MALSIALIRGGGVSVGISEPQGCRTAQDHPRRHAITVCVADLPVEEGVRLSEPDPLTSFHTLLILVSVFAMQGMPTTMPRSLGTEAVAPTCGRRRQLIQGDGLDSESAAYLATSLADALEELHRDHRSLDRRIRWGQG
jgi:hypothetical protein